MAEKQQANHFPLLAAFDASEKFPAGDDGGNSSKQPRQHAEMLWEPSAGNPYCGYSSEQAKNLSLANETPTAENLQSPRSNESAEQVAGKNS